MARGKHDTNAVVRFDALQCKYTPWLNREESKRVEKNRKDSKRVEKTSLRPSIICYSNLVTF